MNPIQTGLALLVTAGAVTAISARERRTALVGLAVALGLSPFLGEPLPQMSTLASRVVGAALAAYLLRAVVERARTTPARGPQLPGGSRIGWPAEALIAAAAWVVAVELAAELATLALGDSSAPATGVIGMLTPAAVAAAAGLASIVVAIVPTFGGRDAMRTTTGSLVLIQGILLFQVGIAGPPGDLEQLGGVVLILALATAGAWLIGAEGRRSRLEAGREPAEDWAGECGTGTADGPRAPLDDPARSSAPRGGTP
ncbi:MAG: hypothetical protein HY264_03780 [Chloroflexi bacterium]|nr:hypothetical protein [Chloroflexota bacterium]